MISPELIKFFFFTQIDSPKGLFIYEMHRYSKKKFLPIPTTEVSSFLSFLLIGNFNQKISNQFCHPDVFK